MAAKKIAKNSKKTVTKTKKTTAPATKSLSQDEVSRLLKPPTDFREITSNVIEVWKTTGKALKVPGHSRGELSRLLKNAEKAADREEALTRKFEAKLKPLADARLRAHHETWQAVLDIYASVKSARAVPQLQEAFAFLADAFARGSTKEPDPTK